jgi:hypothetical protein
MLFSSKKCLVIALLPLASTTLNAQFGKGAVLLEGNAGFAINFKDQDAPEGAKSPYQLSASLSSGWFSDARNEWGIGLGWASGRSYFLNPDPGTFPYPIIFGEIRKAWYISPRVFWRRYSAISDKLLFSSGIALNTSFGQTEFRDFNSSAVLESNATSLNIGYTPSIVYRISPAIGVRGNFGLAGFVLSKVEGSNWQKSLRLSFAPQNLNIGIFLLLRHATTTD